MKNGEKIKQKIANNDQHGEKRANMYILDYAPAQTPQSLAKQV